MDGGEFNHTWMFVREFWLLKTVEQLLTRTKASIMSLLWRHFTLAANSPGDCESSPKVHVCVGVCGCLMYLPVNVFNRSLLKGLLYIFFHGFYGKFFHWKKNVCSMKILSNSLGYCKIMNFASHHYIVDYFPITPYPVMFQSSYIIAVCQLTYFYPTYTIFF